MYDTVLVGTEFTFRMDRNFVFGLEALAWSPSGSKRQAEADGEEINQIKRAGQEIKNWVDAIKQKVRRGKVQQGNTILEEVTVQQGEKKHESPFYEARKVILQFADASDKSIHETWTVNFDLDPNCIELQAQPVPYTFYARHQAMIDALFFSRASCQPDTDWRTGGGGHISLDLAEAFRDNLLYFRNFLVLYAAAVRGSDPRYDILKVSEDSVNAPFMHETEVLPAFIATIEALDQPTSAIGTIEQLAPEINRSVYTAIGPINDPKLTRADFPHYQAVNLEHIINTPLAEQRVELRRFEAQRSVRELLDELQVLFGLLEQSRDGNKYVVDVMGNLSIVP